MLFPVALAAAAAGIASAHDNGREFLSVRKAAASPPTLKRRYLETMPSGDDTSGADRTQVGSAAWAPTTIYDCVVPGTIALAFDDGPHYYTTDLLDKLDAAGYKATFFLNGDNYGRGLINDDTTDWPAIIQRMYDDGHQVASHTWDHEDLDGITADEQKDEMYWNEIAINDIIGVFPTYMRPPYGSCADTCADTMSELGYHIINWNLDPLDFELDLTASKEIWDTAVDASDSDSDSFLSLAHDTLETTVDTLVDYFIASIQANGYTGVPVGTCLGDDAANWYRTNTEDGGTTEGTTEGGGEETTTTTSYPETTDATCGDSGFACTSGYCCSQYNWCGTEPAYCGSGCQSDFGSCD